MAGFSPAFLFYTFIESPVRGRLAEIDSQGRVRHVSRIILSRIDRSRGYKRWNKGRFLIRVILIANIPIDIPRQPNRKLYLRSVRLHWIAGNDVLGPRDQPVALAVVVVEPVARVDRKPLDRIGGDIKVKVVIPLIKLASPKQKLGA